MTEKKEQKENKKIIKNIYSRSCIGILRVPVENKMLRKQKENNQIII